MRSRRLPFASRLDPARWLTGIWRNPDFVKLWGSLTITHFGGQVTFLALPLTAALLLHATPFQVGVLTAMGALPYPIFGLFAGVLVDRARKLPVIVAMDVGRGLALLAIPVCAWFDGLTMPLLYAVNFLIGLASVIGWPAYQVFMTERVGRSNLVEANAKIGVADSAAQLLGPGIAGVLIQWLTAPFAILLDATSFFVSAWMLRGIPPRRSDAPKARARSMAREIREGLDAVWRNRTLRALVWSVSVWQVLRHAFVAIVVLFGARALGFSAGRVGLLFMAAGVGSLVAAHVTERLNRRYGMGPTMLGGLAGTGVAWLVVASATGPLWLASTLFAGGLFLLDLAAMVFFINYLSLRQLATPDALLGRVTATMIALTITLAPIGGVAGGWIADHLGLRTAMAVVGGCAVLLAPLVAWLSPIGGLRELPAHVEPAITESLAEETTF
ncbi:MAG TPA: MFS transporter [Usitatibacter sp.]|nr:MFS transporter [Usitatibacter sp.]